jgi:hypothetical protein
MCQFPSENYKTPPSNSYSYFSMFTLKMVRRYPWARRDDGSTDGREWGRKLQRRAERGRVKDIIIFRKTEKKVEFKEETKEVGITNIL